MIKKCRYCNIERKPQGIRSHERTCKDNPNYVGWSSYIEENYSFDKKFCENSTVARHVIKKNIIKNKLIDYRCKICDLGPVWQNKPMPLILDHINGINNDNRLINLRFVCSNCDTQLPTYKSKNIGE